MAAFRKTSPRALTRETYLSSSAQLFYTVTLILLSCPVNNDFYIEFFFKKLISIFCFPQKHHCVKSVRIRSHSGSYFKAFGLNTDQNNSEYGNFSRSAFY